MRKTTLIVALWVVALGWSGAAGADVEKSWIVRFGALWVDTDLDFRQDDAGDIVQLTGDAGNGFSLVGEYRLNDRLGVELGAQWSENDLELRLTGVAFCGSTFCVLTASDSVRPLTLSLGLDIHLTPGRRADLYVGPVLGYVLYTDPTFRVMDGTLEVLIEDELVWGGVVGLDVPLGDRGWHFSSSIRYLRAKADAEGRDDEGEAGAASLDFDPLAVAVGFGYRF
jgi:outer membrane protein W